MDCIYESEVERKGERGMNGMDKEGEKERDRDRDGEKDGEVRRRRDGRGQS